MTKYTVVEVQEETVLRVWRYEIRAETEDLALEAVQNGEIEPEDLGTTGDGDYGLSGWSIARADECRDQVSEARESLVENA